MSTPAGPPTIDISAVASGADIDTVARLAHEIWYEHYVPIIGKTQVDYMVSKFQSAAAIREQLASGYEYSLILRGAAPVGYLAVRSEPARQALFLSKFYVVRHARGGAGRQAMRFLERLCRQRGLKTIWLTVNRHNPAVQSYLRMGFTSTGSVVTDIGNGFVMDDFRMEKSVE